MEGISSNRGSRYVRILIKTIIKAIVTAVSINLDSDADHVLCTKTDGIVKLVA